MNENNVENKKASLNGGSTFSYSEPPKLHDDKTNPVRALRKHQAQSKQPKTLNNSLAHTLFLTCKIKA